MFFNFIPECSCLFPCFPGTWNIYEIPHSNFSNLPKILSHQDTAANFLLTNLLLSFSPPRPPPPLSLSLAKTQLNTCGHVVRGVIWTVPIYCKWANTTDNKKQQEVWRVTAREMHVCSCILRERTNKPGPGACSRSVGLHRWRRISSATLPDWHLLQEKTWWDIADKTIEVRTPFSFLFSIQVPSVVPIMPLHDTSGLLSLTLSCTSAGGKKTHSLEPCALREYRDKEKEGWNTL